MIQIILFIIGVCISIWLIAKVAKIGWSLFQFAFLMAFAVVFGLPIASAYLISNISGIKKNPMGVYVFMALLTIGCAVVGFNSAGGLDWLDWKYAISGIIFSIIANLEYKRRRNYVEIAENKLTEERAKKHLLIGASTIFLMGASGIASLLHETYFGADVGYWLKWVYFWAALISQLYLLVDLIEEEKFTRYLVADLFDRKHFVYSEELKVIHSQLNCISKKDGESIFQAFIAQQVDRLRFREFEVGDSTYIANAGWIKDVNKNISKSAREKIRVRDVDFIDFVKKSMDLSFDDSKEYLARYFDGARIYEFLDGFYFVENRNLYAINICSSCGFAQLTKEKVTSEWYCSTDCEQTEAICLDIKDKSFADFIIQAQKSGLQLVEDFEENYQSEEKFGLTNSGVNAYAISGAAQAWDQNHKMVAAGGQGHGFAAENANTYVDKVLLRDAKVVGGDNLKNGADRLVDGSIVQTKYLATGARSVGAGFDGQDGLYRYLDPKGRPMQLEVPKDQYDDAVRTMAEKIKKGKVPGTSNPEDALKIVRKGHLTYDQARNITKFGTFESLAYDLAEGAVVSTVAGGICFGISSTLYYIKTKDSKEALRYAAVQAGKTFGRSMVLYVATQQIHRLASIQALLSKIDVSSMSPTVRSFLSDGLGVKSLSGVNKALRGTLVSSVVCILCVTGPDFVKMVQGRISRGQFLKNLGVATAGVAGGVAGSIAGGAIMSPLGPGGVFVGKVLGGAIGGYLAGKLASAIGNRLIEDDRKKIIKIIESQMEYIASIFVFCEFELENFKSNVAIVITAEVLETIHAASNRRSVANLYLKPIAVAVIKQRPIFRYDSTQVIESLAAEEQAGAEIKANSGKRLAFA